MKSVPITSQFSNNNNTQHTVINLSGIVSQKLPLQIQLNIHGDDLPVEESVCLQQLNNYLSQQVIE